MTANPPTLTRTQQALSVVIAYVEAGRRASVKGRLQTVGQGASDAVYGANEAYNATALVASVLEGVKDGTIPRTDARVRLVESLALLQWAQGFVLRSGADDLAYAIGVLIEQVTKAIAALGKAAGDAMAGFWGISPAGAGAGILRVGLAGAALLAWRIPVLAGAYTDVAQTALPILGDLGGRFIPRIG